MAKAFIQDLVLVGGMALVTFGVRYPVLALVGRIELPDSLVRALRYVPAAVLTAIIVPAVLMPDGKQIFVMFTNAYLVAAIVAVGISWRTRSLILTIVSGMVTFYGWRFLISSL